MHEPNLPNLKKKRSQERSTTASNPRESRKSSMLLNNYESSYEAISKEAAESNALASSISLYKRSSEIFFCAELNRLDKDLDAYEIELNNINPLDGFDLQNINQSCEKYQQYLENIAICTKQKDTKLGNCIIRGLIGYKKAFQQITKYLKNLESKKTPAKIRCRDEITQTENSGENGRVKACRSDSPDINFLKELGDKMKNLKVTGVTNHLWDLYDSLCQMRTDVPSPVETPDLIKFDIKEENNGFEDGVENLRKEWVSSLARQKTIKQTQCAEKGCQVENKGIDSALESIAGEKELEILKLKRRCDTLLEEKKKFDDEISFKNLKIYELTGKLNEIAQLQNKVTEISIELKSEKSINSISKEKLEKSKLTINSLKKECENLKTKLIGKRNKLLRLKDEFLQRSVLWRMAEEKNKQIEESWLQVHGSKFVYSGIDANEIMKKYGLQKELDSDNEGSDATAVSNFDIKRNRNFTGSYSQRPNVNRNKGKPMGFNENSQETHDAKNSKNKYWSQDEKLEKISENEILNKKHHKKSQFENRGSSLSNSSEEHDYEDKDGIFMHQSLRFDISNKKLENAEKALVVTLNKEQKNLFKKFKNLLQSQYPHFAQYTENLKSTITDKLETLESASHSKDIKKFSKHKNKLKETNFPKGDLNQTLSTLPKSFLNDSFDKEKNDEIPNSLASIFKNKAEYQALSPYTKRLLEQCMEGHDYKKCGAECEHLKRAMAIKAKYNGRIYHLRTASLDFDYL
ncbi:unnamed protein product [Blepharisma stoltei]|uniref:Uncharacterized protein n=1 Tax=Blepharisma stoltei TaxID=1481888 RepID=A0AAU9K8W8_9CILI|nr:unnamed protein product [Blepharisma stoltei]